MKQQPWGEAADNFYYISSLTASKGERIIKLVNICKSYHKNTLQVFYTNHGVPNFIIIHRARNQSRNNIANRTYTFNSQAGEETVDNNMWNIREFWSNEIIDEMLLGSNTMQQ